MKNEKILCFLGCGNEAKFTFKNGNHYCCKNISGCPTTKEKKKQKNDTKTSEELEIINDKRKKYWENLTEQELEIINNKKKETCLSNYMVENPSQCPEIQTKKIQTNLENLGVEHPCQSKEIQEKMKQTMLKNHNVEHPSQSKEIQDKVKQTWANKSDEELSIIQEKYKQTCLEKYNTENPMQNKEIQERLKQTLLDLYNVENISQSEENKNKIRQTWANKSDEELKEILEKHKQTCFNNHGVTNPSQADEIKNKKTHTNLKNNGVTNPSQCPEIQAKKIQTNLTLYNAENFNQKHISPESRELMKDLEWLILQNQTKTLAEIAFDLGISSTPLILLFKANNIQTKLHYSSFEERQVLEFIQSIYKGEIITNDRTIIKPMELDIYLPELKLAIEYCGLYWHSEKQGKGKYYHLNKLIKCQEQGIDLITIFSDEWIINQEEYKDKLVQIINGDYQFTESQYNIDRTWGLDLSKFGYTLLETTEPKNWGLDDRYNRTEINPIDQIWDCGTVLWNKN
jgi:hypothetical protein